MIQRDGVTKRVILGASGAITSPLATPTAVCLIDIEIVAGAVMNESLSPTDTAFVWV